MPNLSLESRRLLLQEGAFPGISMLLKRRVITEAEARALKASVYKAVLVEVEEARKELNHIQTALNAMSNAARNGARNPGAANDASYDQMTHHLITFDAWVVSLLETDLTITGLLNPSHTRSKITKLATAMNALMDKRAAEVHPVMDDPNLFRDYVDR